ncbi:ankyrin repeat domain-containing protein [Listeria costaricensis]|uniref:ankyrin repeat domain-containing protein n=1 Tax=Listeria costaricensis TaxID=2026604 RepID=UPI0019699A5D|nr:ankyrin repeat domain-containing protein [Listeria costaricensis]
MKVKNLGDFEHVPDILQAISAEDILQLEKKQADGWDILAEIELDEYTIYTPVNFAIMMDCFAVVKWLVERGAELNSKKEPSFLLAVRYSENEAMIRYLADKGADIHAVNNVKSEAFTEAIYGKKFHNLPLIEALGHSVAKYGGKAFRSAVSDRNYSLLDFFIAHGVDVDFNQPDMVYSFKPTPLCVAARYVDLEMCRYLVANGADVKLAEKDGMRPYSIAVERGDEEMAAYFRALEPVEFHQKENKLLALKSYRLSKDVKEFLQGEQLHIELEGDVAFVDFFTLTDTIEMKIGRKKYLRISKKVDNYSDLHFLWNPRTKKIACYDEEHLEVVDMAPFSAFIQDISGLIERLFMGEFDN